MKDIKITFRNPILLLFSVVMPVVFIFLYSMITQVSATNPIVIGRNSYGAASDNFIEILQSMKSVDGPYFTVDVLDGNAAMSLYEQGKAAAIIDIPADFDKNIEENRPSNANLYITT
jgi:maltose-binding protein MalE